MDQRCLCGCPFAIDVPCLFPRPQVCCPGEVRSLSCRCEEENPQKLQRALSTWGAYLEMCVCPSKYSFWCSPLQHLSGGCGWLGEENPLQASPLPAPSTPHRGQSVAVPGSINEGSFVSLGGGGGFGRNWPLPKGQNKLQGDLY